MRGGDNCLRDLIIKTRRRGEGHFEYLSCQQLVLLAALNLAVATQVAP